MICSGTMICTDDAYPRRCIADFFTVYAVSRKLLRNFCFLITTITIIMFLLLMFTVCSVAVYFVLLLSYIIQLHQDLHADCVTHTCALSLSLTDTRKIILFFNLPKLGFFHTLYQTALRKGFYLLSWVLCLLFFLPIDHSIDSLYFKLVIEETILVKNCRGNCDFSSINYMKKQ